GVFRADWAGASCPAAEFQAIAAGGRCEVPGAALDVVVAGRECADGAGVEAGLRLAGEAWRGRVLPFGQPDRLGESEERPIGLPEAEFRMDVEPERRGVAGPCAAAPEGEGKRRRLEGE